MGVRKEKNRLIKADFFRRETMVVAREILGKLLVRKVGGQRLSGRITEVEVYHGMDDLACHASRGRTVRTEVMFGEAGRVYVYLIYGMYYCLNLVTMPPGWPAAILVRGMVPVEGIEIMKKNRLKKNVGLSNLTDGPGKICQAMGIDKSLNGKRLGQKAGLWLEDDGMEVGKKKIVYGKRVGVGYAKHCAQWEWNLRVNYEWGRDVLE